MAALRLEWSTHAMMGAYVADGDSRLSLVMHQQANGETTAMALETTEESLAAALDAHAHELIGQYESIEKAQRACVEYARKWLKRRKELKRCECKPIASARRKRSHGKKNDRSLRRVRQGNAA